MSKIRKLIYEDSRQAVFEENSVENSILKTVRLFINDNSKAVLPTIAIGDIVWNMALIMDTVDSTVIESEVTVRTDGWNVIFDPLDEVKGKYCIISYLTYKA